MSAFDAYIRLDGALAGSIVCDESMARHTTYHIGGPAALFVQCASLADLTLTLDILAEEEVPWICAGKGSNMLVSDEGIEGAVITLSGEFARMDFGGYAPETDERPADVFVTVGAGTILSRLVQEAHRLELAGLEFAIGTPGCVGGALFMNAGTSNGWMGSVVSSVTTYVPGKGLCKRRADELPWEYRHSGIPAGEVIVEAELQLHPADKMRLHASMEAALKRRKASQPLELPSCGSVFRNPEGGSAAQLIEACGLKGHRVGGAQISEKHANFIVNTGSATAQDVLELIKLARDCVRRDHGVELKTEVRFVGFQN